MQNVLKALMNEWKKVRRETVLFGVSTQPAEQHPQSAAGSGVGAALFSFLLPAMDDCSLSYKLLAIVIIPCCGIPSPHRRDS